MQNKYTESLDFVKAQFKEFGLIKQNLPDESQRELTLYRWPKAQNLFPSRFILLDIWYDFRDSDWAILLSLGDGFPELSEDRVELGMSTVALNKSGLVTYRERRDWDETDAAGLENELKVPIQFCLDYMKGGNSIILKKRETRNQNASIDPLGIESSNKHIANNPGIRDRNEELKALYEKYL